MDVILVVRKMKDGKILIMKMVSSQLLMNLDFQPVKKTSDIWKCIMLILFVVKNIISALQIVQ